MKAIIIDWDDTIADFRYWIIQKWLRTLSYVENEYGFKGFNNTFWKIYKNNSIYYHNVLRDTLNILDIDIGLHDTIIEYFKNVQADDIIFEGAEDFLKKSKEVGYKIGMMTNGNKRMYESRVKNSGLSKYFDVLHYGCEGSKPSLSPVVKMLNTLNVEPRNTVSIGDDIRDLLVPYFYGMTPIQFTLKNPEHVPFDTPVKTAGSFKELGKILWKEDNIC